MADILPSQSKVRQKSESARARLSEASDAMFVMVRLMVTSGSFRHLLFQLFEAFADMIGDVSAALPPDVLKKAARAPKWFVSPPATNVLSSSSSTSSSSSSEDEESSGGLYATAPSFAIPPTPPRAESPKELRDTCIEQKNNNQQSVLNKGDVQQATDVADETPKVAPESIQGVAKEVGRKSYRLAFVSLFLLNACCIQ